MRRSVAIATMIILAATWLSGQGAVESTGGRDAVRFAVIGDNGTGGKEQYDVGRQMAVAHGRLPFDFVLMLGDNMYGRQQLQDFIEKFEPPCWRRASPSTPHSGITTIRGTGFTSPST
jgi:hypothetical protein